MLRSASTYSLCVILLLAIIPGSEPLRSQANTANNTSPSTTTFEEITISDTAHKLYSVASRLFTVVRKLDRHIDILPIVKFIVNFYIYYAHTANILLSG